jgi:pimeloyl-ACP methyl ester carboxylesterase
MPIDVKRGLVRTQLGTIHYREAGAGPAIVLLHINQQSSETFLELMAALAPRMRVVAVDYPSHGGSDHVAAQPGIPDYARCVHEVLQVLGIRETVALGEATGAAVCVELANGYPGFVRKVVLVNCPFLGDAAMRAALLDEMQHQLRPADDTGFPKLRTIDFLLTSDPDHAPMRPTQSWMDRINRAQVEAGRDRWQALTALLNYDLGSALGRLDVPALLLMGEHFYFGHRAGEIRSRVRDLRTEVLPDTRFCACWERAAEIAEKTLDFAA